MARAAEIKKDIVYGRPDGVELKMDVGRPEGGYGPFRSASSSWRRLGERQKDKDVGPMVETLTGAGFVWFSID